MALEAYPAIVGIQGHPITNWVVIGMLLVVRLWAGSVMIRDTVAAYRVAGSGHRETTVTPKSGKLPALSTLTSVCWSMNIIVVNRAV